MSRSILTPGQVGTAPGPVYFTREGALYRLRIWTEREWASMPSGDRLRADHVPGLGWVGGDFIEAMN